MGVFKENNLLSPHPFIYSTTEDEKTTLPLQDNVHGSLSQFSPKGVPSDYYDTTDTVFTDKRIVKIINKLEEPFLNADGTTWVQRSEFHTRNPLLKNRSICQSISFYLPSRIVGGNEKNLITGLNMQWHGGGGGTNPFCNITLEEGRIRLLTRWASSGFNSGYMWFDLGPATRDTWHHFIFYHELQFDINLGRRTVWQKTGAGDWALARCHHPITGEPWTVPIGQTGETDFSNSALWIAFPAKGTLPIVDSGVSLLDWHGKTWYDLPIDSIYFKWGKYASGTGDFYDANGDPVNTNNPGGAHYIEPGSYHEVWFTNVAFGLLDVGETEGELFGDLAFDDGQPTDYPADMDFTSAPPPTTYALTLDIAPVGFGTVDQTPAGPHEAGATVALSATPGSGNQFDGWYDGVTLLSTANPYNYTMPGSAKTITGQFSATPTYSVTVTPNDPAMGSAAVTPAGPYEANTQVSISATPTSGHQFVRFHIGGTTMSTDNPHSFNIGSLDWDNIIAEFEVIPVTTYALTVAKTPTEGGTVSVVSASTLAAGAPAEVLAVAALGYAFQYWQNGAGDQVSTAANYLFNMPAADLQLTAVFFPTYTVEVTVSPVGFGTAEVSPPEPQIAWEQTTITATPATGKQFVRWSIGGSTFATANPHTFSNPGFNYEILAEFEDVPAPPSFALTVAKSPTAGGTVTEVSTGPYQSGDPVDVLAAPATGYEFLRWEIGGLQVSTAASYQFSMPAADTTITAIFQQITHALTLEATPSASGTLLGAGSYAPGTVVELGAQAAAGWAFSYWMADSQVLSTNATFNYTMPTGPITVTAFFESTGTASLPSEFSLSLSTAGTAGVAEGGGIFTEGSTVTVTATPLNTNLGGRFLYWKNGDQIVSYQPQYTFVMPSENTSLTAHFELSEMNTAQALVMVRDYVKVSVMPTIPDEGIIEMECTLRFEQEYGTGTMEDIAYYVNPYLYDLGRVDFHLDRALLGRMRFHRPDLSITLNAVPCNGVVHRYGFTYRLMVDGEPTGSNTVESGLHAWLAGKPYAFPDVNPWEGKAYLWLTTRPMVRPVHPMERNIFYIMPLETGEYTLETVIHYKNTIKETSTRSLGSQDRYRPFFFRYFLPDDWEDILQIELAIRGRILTEEVLTLRPQADPQFAAQVFFGNSLGGFDSFCFAGKQENFSETTGELLETALQPDHDRQEGTLSAYNRLSYDSLVLRTGYVSLPEKNALKDMSLRNHIYLVDGTELRKILLENTESFDRKDGTYIHSAEYRARLAFDNNSYYGRDPRQ